MCLVCGSADLSKLGAGETAPVKLRVMLAGDSPEFLDSAVRLMRLVPKSAVRCVMSGEEALAELEQFSPDVILLDLILPDMDGLKIAQRVKQRPNPPRVVVVSSSDDPLHCDAARAAGADSLISKEGIFLDLLHCIGTLHQQSPAEAAPAGRIAA